MDGTSQAAVTPQGVRDGDPAVLAALVARRGPAVLAFCEVVCDPEVAPQAVAEALARFRALVSTVDDAGGVDPEAFLLGATRHAAASMARVPTDGRGVLRALGRGTSPEVYAAVPALLAARADSMLGAEDLERLSRLLERSPGCREVEAAFRRAERGYRSPPDRPLAPETVALVIGAMQAAAPVAEAFAGPAGPEPAVGGPGAVLDVAGPAAPTGGPGAAVDVAGPAGGTDPGRGDRGAEADAAAAARPAAETDRGVEADAGCVPAAGDAAGLVPPADSASVRDRDSRVAPEAASGLVTGGDPGSVQDTDAPPVPDRDPDLVRERARRLLPESDPGPVPAPDTTVHSVLSLPVAGDAPAAHGGPAGSDPAADEPAPFVAPARAAVPPAAESVAPGPGPGPFAAAGVDADAALVSPIVRHRARRGLPRLSLPHGGGRHLPRRAPAAAEDPALAEDHGPVYRLLLPAVAILVAVLVMLVIAGVFGGAEPAPATILAPSAAAIAPAAAPAAPATAAAPAATRTPRPVAAPRRARSRETSGGTRTTTPGAPATTPAPAATPSPTTTTARAPVRVPATPPRATTPRQPATAPTVDKAGSGSALPGPSGAAPADDEPVYQPGTVPAP